MQDAADDRGLHRPIGRRALLAGGAGLIGALTVSRFMATGSAGAVPLPATEAALAALGRRHLRYPGSLPYPALRPGTDTMPAIAHVVVLMMENHSYDNFFGMLGRGRGQRPRGDGFTLGSDGTPLATNPYSDGRLQHAFRMPTTCQLSGTPSQQWTAGHNAWDSGRMDGFVRTVVAPGSTETVGGVAMGYWDGEQLPFLYSLAETFPIGDRWFCSTMCQTDPNRRYLIAATSAGMTGDIGTAAGNLPADAGLALPAHGTIFDLLDLHGIAWANYVASFPTGATPELYPADDAVSEQLHMKPFEQFYSDARSGALPGFSLLDPNYSTQSQENPQDISVGEGLLASVVQAVGESPAWGQTLLVITWDEWGGYYDHVPPPAALAPDSIPPFLLPGEKPYDGFARYGMRVPSVVVSPYARRNHVTSVLHDHTSILAMVERKWNLPALTFRDANANDLSDFLDLQAMSQREPTFTSLPRLAAPNDGSAALACQVSGPGTIPPPGSVTGPVHAPQP